MSGEPYRLRFLLLGLPTPDRNSRRHWSARHKEDDGWHRSVRFAVLGREPDRPLPCARVSYVRHSAVECEPDNLADSFKPITDALRRIGILEDDKARNFVGGRPDVRWEKAPPRAGHITVTVEEPNDGQESRTADHATRPRDGEGGRAQ